MVRATRKRRWRNVVVVEVEITDLEDKRLKLCDTRLSGSCPRKGTTVAKVGNRRPNGIEVC